MKSLITEKPTEAITPRPIAVSICQANNCQKVVDFYDKTLAELGLGHACASIRTLDAIPDNQGLLAGKEDEVFPALEALARSAIDDDGADVILLGSTTMHQAHGYLAERLPVPVINPGPMSYKLAETALGLGLTQSRKAYPASPASRGDLVRRMLENAQG